MGRLRQMKRYLLDVATIKTHPHEIALGFAIGVFISTMPTPGFNILVGLLLLFFIRMNKISLLAGLALVNPFLTPLIYSTELRIGQLFIPYNPIADVAWYSWQNLFANIKPFLIGALILATCLAIMSYAVLFLITFNYQMRKHKGLHPRSPAPPPMLYRLRDAGKYTAKYTMQAGKKTVKQSTRLVKATGRAGVAVIKKGARAVTPRRKAKKKVKKTYRRK